MHSLSRQADKPTNCRSVYHRRERGDNGIVYIVVELDGKAG